MLPKSPKNYQDACDRFQWQVPEHYNIGYDACGKWAQNDTDRLALVFVDDYGKTINYTFGQIYSQACKFGNLLRSYDVQAGDRVAILLPQAPETAFAHIGAYSIGAIALPLFTLFGTQAIKYRLSDSGAKVVITNAEGAAKIAEIRSELPDLKFIFTIDGTQTDTLDFQSELNKHNDDLATVDTLSTDPAVIIYTSGTTGNPKGALHAHKILPGHLPGVEISHNLFPQPGDRIWTPADWAWIGGLYDVLMPAWHHGIAVVAHRFKKFSAEAAFELLQDHQVRNTFLPPTALKMMRTIDSPEKRWNYSLRSVASGGESLGHELLSWGEKTFGLIINEFYGQTECNMTVSSCADLFPVKAGAIGKPVPGHNIAVIDDAGNQLATGEMGHIAVGKPNPSMFLRYWNNDKATTEKFINDWLITGDTGIFDEDGYIHFVGRSDDVITSAGYRIGPAEIEDCILQFPGVKMVAVVGMPDAQRTEIVTAVVVLNDGVEPGDEIKKSIQDHVKKHLAAYEYPREVYFVDELPMTTTGKVIRKQLRQEVQKWHAASTD